MQSEDRLPLSLFLLRIGVFVVMLVWTLDKFVNPTHSETVYSHFYFMDGLGHSVMYAIGAVELVLLIAFLIGFQKRVTYGAVLLLHTVSTLSSFKQYLAPYERGNIMFFAAWPMLAACIALYLLRDQDVKWSI